ncbi:metallophosphoesterase family protein [Acidisoma silvae]|uniref:DNA repair exonuclease n=1 Tax=Acidisoma silvae TaxID=2802396 RepID=A0A963YW54_9PROT|nr:DNA repair exonuclease [Acidisoma silvae]MCB8877959.1 DNA repair exonuclease [Acidisoma silvae]
MRFIHTADWQLGKPFGRFQPEVRVALADARLDVVDTIGRLAVSSGTKHVLVAGDVFDSDGPEDRVLVQALSRMARHTCQWWLLPGNHDAARTGGLWDRIRSKGVHNVRVLTEPTAIEMEPGVWLLPAPLQLRHQLEDPTVAFDRMETPGARLRIGLGHGSIRDFSMRGETRNQIAADRARQSKLDYLALGDWHGVLQIDGRTWYAGTPEADGFQRNDPGQVLLVELDPQREPVVTPHRTGKFQWLQREWRLQDDADFLARWQALQREVDPSSTLLQLTLTGIVGLADRVSIIGRLESEARHILRYLDLRADDLSGQPTDEDLAALHVEGMLGVAADKLKAKIAVGGVQAALAKRALERLYVEAQRGRDGI